MELLQLRYFLTVAKMGSMTRAAEHYRIPQSSMSQTIGRLEKELGAQLFDRYNNRISLNENGRTFLKYTNNALNEIEMGKEALKSDKNEISGPINLLAIENRRFMFNCVARFAELFPKVNFSISHDGSSEYYFNYDLCVSSNTHQHRTELSVPCIKERILLNIHMDHPLAKRDCIDLAELKNERFICMTSRTKLFSITYDNCRSCGFEPIVPFICDDPYYVRKYVSEKMGIALVPEVSWAGRFREDTTLIPLKQNITTTSFLFWDGKRSLSNAVSAFRDFLFEEALKLPNNLLHK